MQTMDILRPEIIKIGRRRYRSLQQSDDVILKQEYGSPYCFEEDSYYYEEAEGCTSEYDNITKFDDGRYSHILKDIPSFYYKFVIGKGGEMKKSIENQTRSLLRLPRKGCEGDIEITGTERSGVIAATTKIRNIIDLHRAEQPARHFLSMQLISEDLCEKFREFKSAVLKVKARGIDESIFQIPQRLHITLCMMSFLNDQEIEDNLIYMKEKIKELKNQYMGKYLLSLHLKGVEYMNDDPSEVDVLYVKVSPLHAQTERLQSFVDEVVSSLYSVGGYIKKDHDLVKLHCTVMNTIFRNNSEKQTFDANDILSKFSDFDFGQISISSLDICIRGQFDHRGHYKSAGVLPL